MKIAVLKILILGGTHFLATRVFEAGFLAFILQLSYLKGWGNLDLNQRPAGYEPYYPV